MRVILVEPREVILTLATGNRGSAIVPVSALLFCVSQELRYLSLLRLALTVLPHVAT